MRSVITVLGMTCTRCQVGLPFHLELLYVSDLSVQDLCYHDVSLQDGHLNVSLNCCSFFLSGFNF
jgi:hypothetical protein